MQRVFFIALIWLCNLWSHGQEPPPMSMDKINLDFGHINHIHKDSGGYLWLSTQAGLVRHNSNHWKLFKPSRKDTLALPDKYTWLTYEDWQGRMWVGSFEGNLSLYHPEIEKFEPYSIPSDKGGVRTILQADKHTLLVGTDVGLFLFDLKNKAFIHDIDFRMEQDSAEIYHVQDLSRLDDNRFLLSGTSGMAVLSLEERSVLPLRFPGHDPNSMLIHQVDHNLILLADSDGLLVFQSIDDMMNNRQSRYIRIGEHIGITDIEFITEHYALVSSNIGLFYIEIETGKVTMLTKEETQDKVAYSICHIEPDLYWIGTKTGVIRLLTSEDKFKTIDRSKLCNNAILGMTEDHSGNLWVATRSGLARIKNYDLQQTNWQYFCYKRNDLPSLPTDYILNLMYARGTWWMGLRRSGFMEFRLTDEDELILNRPPPALAKLTHSTSVNEMYTDNEGHVWIGTSGNGLIKWEADTVLHLKSDPANKGMQLSHNFVYDFIEIGENEIAVATAQGINLINKHTLDISEQFFLIQSDTSSLVSDFIMDFHRDQAGNIWISTSAGISLWNTEEHTFKNWTADDGLTDDVIYGMQSLGQHHWVSTNHGLHYFTQHDQNQITFRNFTEADGVINNEHNQFAHYLNKKGEIIFGGKNGITILNPDSMLNNQVDATAVIEHFYLFNKNADDRLDQSITVTDKLVLRHDENFISFDLAALSYHRPEQNRFRYKMIGLNNDWIDLGNRPYLSFNGLSPGVYELQIMSSNNDGIWGSVTRSLDITILRPWYNRWYAWLFYVCLLGGILLYIYLIKLNALKRVAQAKEEERNKIRERSARDFHDEAGVIITRLSLLTQHIKHKNQDEDQAAISQLENNIQKLRTGMRDFIWVLDPSKDSLKSTIQKLNEMGNTLFEHSPIQFKTHTAHIDRAETIILESIERRQLLLIVKEAINNTLKHSNATSCTLKIRTEPGKILIELSDDGIGISKDEVNGHGLKNMKERAANIHAKLTIDSDGSRGTSIQLEFPIHPNGS